MSFKKGEVNWWLWTPEEDTILIVAMTFDARQTAIELLPGRSWSAIYNRYRKLCGVR